MRFKLILIMIFSGSMVMGQSRLMDRGGTVSFFLSTPVEDIEAVNEQALAAVDLNSGTVAASMLMKGFRFEKALMEEHFNEKYLESDKYPKSTFQGQIENYGKDSFLSDQETSLTVSGNITIHGVTKPISATIQKNKKDNMIYLKTTFNLMVADFEIEIPGIVRDNIAKVVEVNATFEFKVE